MRWVFGNVNPDAIPNVPISTERCSHRCSRYSRAFGDNKRKWKASGLNQVLKDWQFSQDIDYIFYYIKSEHKSICYGGVKRYQSVWKTHLISSNAIFYFRVPLAIVFDKTTSTNLTVRHRYWQASHQGNSSRLHWQGDRCHRYGCVKVTFSVYAELMVHSTLIVEGTYAIEHRHGFFFFFRPLGDDFVAICRPVIQRSL